jgi:hypothetical protein
MPTTITLTGGRHTRQVQLQHGKFAYSLDAASAAVDLRLGELRREAYLDGGLAGEPAMPLLH